MILRFSKRHGHGLAHGRDGHDPLEVEVAVIVEKRVIGQSLYLFQNLFDRDIFLGNADRGGGEFAPVLPWSEKAIAGLHQGF